MKRFISVILLVIMLHGCCYAESTTGLGGLIDGFLDFWSNLYEETTNKSHTEVVAELRDMGIDVPDEAVEKTEEEMASFQKELSAIGYEYTEPSYEFASNLLMIIGMGEYDYDTGIWTPTSSKVYAFDAEIFDIDHMYHLFLQGVSSIVPGFEPVDIHESIEENTDDSYGKTTVSFVLNGNKYEHELCFMGDWFDEDAIDWINEVLAQEGFEYRLYKFYDWKQGLLLLYGDDSVWEKICDLIPQPEF